MAQDKVATSYWLPRRTLSRMRMLRGVLGGSQTDLITDLTDLLVDDEALRVAVLTKIRLDRLERQAAAERERGDLSDEEINIWLARTGAEALEYSGKGGF